MLHSSHPFFRGVTLLAALLVPVSLWGAGSDSSFKARRFLVESTPAGADVFVIGGKRGKTPLSLSERDIYPNWYPDDQSHLYGVIILRKAGCDDFTKRITLDDIGKGINAQLDCSQDATPAERRLPPAAHTQQAPPESAAPVQSMHATAMQRRLRQLKVLQELLDDGLISEEEERTIRKRILNAP
jgi:hypothetical protein